MIHAVGPNYHSLPDDESDNWAGDALAIRLAWPGQEEKCKTVAFSLLSAIFRQAVARHDHAISVGAVADGAYEGLERVHLTLRRPGLRELKAAAATRFCHSRVPGPRRDSA